jgi:hypothetical protein
VRTTIEIQTEHRIALMALAARRGQKGFSTLVAEAIEEYLNREPQLRELRTFAARTSLGAAE